MNEQTEQNVNEAIDWLQKTGGSIQDFAVEQAPLYCREVVAWELWMGGICTATGLILLIVAGLCIRVGVKLQWDEDECHKWLPALFVAILSLIMGITALCQNADRPVKALAAPRMVVVEHLKEITKP